MALTSPACCPITHAVRRAPRHCTLAPRILWILLCNFLAFPLSAAETFRVATYNLENYLDQPTGTRPLKTPEAKTKIRESLRALQADIVALQEMGAAGALAELLTSLKAEGLHYPFWEYVRGW